MTIEEELEALEQDKEDFESWWHNEGSAGPTEAQAGLDTEGFVQVKAREAWLNGAYKARERQIGA